MAKLWEGMSKVVMAGTHKALEEASGGVRCSHWHSRPSSRNWGMTL
jgi:hypothetical protein